MKQFGADWRDELDGLLAALGLSEEPMGIGFSDICPEGAFQPAKGETPTRELEAEKGLDWQALTRDFSCAMGHVWRARRKHKAACFSAERFGCLGAAFWMGFSGPSTDGQIHYVSTGIPGALEGECYMPTPEDMKRITEEANPVCPPKKHIVIRSVSQWEEAGETPEVVAFFSRPESLAGLHQLAAFITANREVVVSPWGPGCGGIITWPLHYLRRGETRAVLGGWDPSARKFYKTDELSFTVPLSLFGAMLKRWQESFLRRGAWSTARRKAERSSRVWGE